jgi:hypothetical protein
MSGSSPGDFSASSTTSFVVHRPKPTLQPTPAGVLNYIERKIDLTFQLNSQAKPVGVAAGPDTPNVFKETGGNVVKLSGLRCSVNINKTAGKVDAHVQVWGMTLDQMNKLSLLGTQYSAIGMNRLTIEAGDAENGMTEVFTNGAINAAYLDARGMPDVSFVLEAAASGFQQVVPVAPTSLPGPSVDVATQMKQFATQMGFDFHDGGVNVKLPSCYFAGSLWDQARVCAQHANIGWIVDHGVLSIWPKNTTPPGRVILIGPTSGLIEYPTFSSFGIEASCAFYPALIAGPSGGINQTVEIKSEIQSACGQWNIFQLTLELESEKPGGAWSMNFAAGVDPARGGRSA